MQRVADASMVEPYGSLFQREREIFQLIAEGHSDKDVALILSINPASVETHEANILQERDVHSTAELVLVPSEKASFRDPIRGSTAQRIRQRAISSERSETTLT